jgi:hypothetical protein
MTPEQFAYWLQGFAEMSTERPSEAQWKMIQAHLNTVFKKVTPSLTELLKPEQVRIGGDPFGWPSGPHYTPKIGLLPTDGLVITC